MGIGAIGIACLTGGKSRPRGAITFGLFAAIWGIQIAAANLATIAPSLEISTALFTLSTLLLLPLAFLLVEFSLSQGVGSDRRPLWLGARVATVGTAAVAAVVLLFEPTLLLKSVGGSAGAFFLEQGNLFAPLVNLPLFTAFGIAMVALYTGKAASPTPRTSGIATILLAGLGTYVAFTAANNFAFYTYFAFADGLFSDMAHAVVFLILAAICLNLGFRAVRRSRAARAGDEARRERLVAAALLIPFAWGLIEFPLSIYYLPALDTFGLWRLAGVAVIAYGLARWRVFDLPQRTQSAAATAVGATGAAAGGALAYSAAAIAFPGLLIPAIAGVLVAGASLVPGVRVAKRIVYTMKGQSQEKLEETLYGQRIETYRAALEASLARGSLEADEPFLAALRERFGITEPEDRVLRHYAKSSVLVPREGDGASTYERLRLLGEGGGGRTWLARDRVRDRLVVIKEPLGRWQHEPALKENVLREARLASKVRHPNVVAIEEVAEHNGCPVIVMEYLEGGSVEDMLRSRGNLPWRESVSLVEGVLRGLEAVHAAGIVHRDVKPSNVLLSGDRVPKLADFGVAIPSSTGGKTVVEAGATTLAGTMAYMSPEQRAGTSIGDRQSDLYACAALLHECLYGTPPVPGAVIRFQNDLPAGLQAVIARGLAANPGERYTSARAFAEDLRRAAAAPGGKA